MSLSRHRDDCDVTINLCLGRTFDGGSLTFYPNNSEVNNCLIMTEFKFSFSEIFCWSSSWYCHSSCWNARTSGIEKTLFIQIFACENTLKSNCFWKRRMKSFLEQELTWYFGAGQKSRIFWLVVMIDFSFVRQNKKLKT